MNVRTYVSMEGSLASVNENTALSLSSFAVLCLQEEKSNTFEMAPFLETKNVPHFLCWGRNKTAKR